MSAIGHFLLAATHHIVEGFGDVLANGLDESKNYPIFLSHFSPYTQFKEVGEYSFQRADSNGDCYWKEELNVIRLKCLGLIFATPIVHAVGLVLNVANRVAKMISFAHFWYPMSVGCSKRSSWSKDLLRVVSSPFIYIGLELSAVYGLFLPENGRKLYATFERCAYGKELLAPCFQPDPKYHLGGGTPMPNRW